VKQEPETHTDSHHQNHNKRLKLSALQGGADLHTDLQLENLQI
jgi:hypothetical protein